VLSEMESKAVLRAFRIPVAQTMVARTPTESLLLAEQIGFPVAMKVDSPDLVRKTEAGGVRLNITNAPAVRNAYHDIIETVQKSIRTRASTAFRSSPIWRARTAAS
jgi:acetyltransferase